MKVQIPNTDVTIIGRELFLGKKYNFKESLLELSKKNKFMPRMELFIPYLIDIIGIKNNRLDLYNHQGKKISLVSVHSLCNYLIRPTRAHSSWLNDKIVDGKGFNKLDLISYRVEEGKLVEDIREPLEECLMEFSYVDLDPENFTYQGLPKPKAKSKVQRYSPGNNIYFGNLVKSSVIRFNSYFDGTGLSCNMGPNINKNNLGSFGCSESKDNKRRGEDLTLDTIRGPERIC